MLGSRKKGVLMPSKSCSISLLVTLVPREKLMSRSVFEGSSITYPSRRVTHEDNGDAKMGSYVVLSFCCFYTDR